MSETKVWLRSVLRSGLVLAGVGLLLVATGLGVTSLGGQSEAFGMLSVVSGLGVTLVGTVALLQYRYGRLHPGVAAEMAGRERDERLRWIRARAGQRAFWMSSSLALFVLVWAALAGEVGLPTLTYASLWYSLAMVLLVSVLVYLTGVAIGRFRH